MDNLPPRLDDNSPLLDEHGQIRQDLVGGNSDTGVVSLSKVDKFADSLTLTPMLVKLAHVTGPPLPSVVATALYHHYLETSGEPDRLQYVYRCGRCSQYSRWSLSAVLAGHSQWPAPPNI